MEDHMENKNTALIVAGTLAAAAGIYFALRWRSRAKNSSKIVENSRITVSGTIFVVFIFANAIGSLIETTCVVRHFIQIFRSSPSKAVEASH